MRVGVKIEKIVLHIPACFQVAQLLAHMSESGVGQLSVFAKYEKTRHELADIPQRSSSTFNIDSGDEIEIVELLLFRMQLELQHNRATLLRGSGLEND